MEGLSRIHASLFMYTIRIYRCGMFFVGAPYMMLKIRSPAAWC
jgi:hypothetical protein